jgi:hypothetical protein
MAKFNAMRDAALDYATRGWAVFPADSSGVKKSHKAAEFSNGQPWGKTVDPAEIARDFAKWPDANIGIPTGPEAGIFVIEADTPEGDHGGVDGIASLRALEAEHGALPATLMAESPSGSLHFYFTYPPGVVIRSVAGKIAPGVDQRGHGGMVIAPPSLRPGVGKYRWLNENEIVDAPAWLIQLVTADDHKAKANGADNDPPPEHIRARAASGRGTSDDAHDLPDRATREDIERAVRAADPNALPSTYQVWFEMTAAIRHELGDAGRELFHAWASKSPKYVARDCDQKWRDVAGVTGYTAATIFHFADQASPGWRDEPQPKAGAQPEPSKLDALLASAADLQHMIFDPLRWVVPDILPEGCTVLAGKPKIGKSWLALDVAIAVASGGQCLGKPCEPGDVLALLLEDNKRRLQRRMTTMLGANKERWPARLRYATEWARGDDGIALMRDWVAAVEKPRWVDGALVYDLRVPFGYWEAKDEEDDLDKEIAAKFRRGYGILHDPIYREKYAQNLKREFPRIPFYDDFWKWAEWGEKLMALHIGYEAVKPWKLKRFDVTDEKSTKAKLLPKPSLKADKDNGIIILDSETQLTGVPSEAWTYKLGNRSALEWILDQHKEKMPLHPTIRAKFNTYRFADHKEKVIDLLMRVTRVSVETMGIVETMKSEKR